MIVGSREFILLRKQLTQTASFNIQVLSNVFSPTSRNREDMDVYVLLCVLCPLDCFHV